MGRRVVIWAVVGLVAAWGSAVRAEGPTTAPARQTPAGQQSLSVLLEEGIYTEETVGDLDTAISIYEQVLEQAKSMRPIEAQAQFRLGVCRMKKGKALDAIASFHRVISDYPEQKELALLAEKKIADAREGMGEAEIARIVGEVVTSISTMTEVDPKIPKLLQSLRELKESSVQAIADMLANDKSGFARRCTAYALGLRGDPKAKALLEKALKDPDQFVRNNAQAALTMLAQAEREALKAKLINWVEKFFSENYCDITARKPLEWGDPESTPGGNLSIRYKYLAIIWNKDKLIIEQRFTFTPQGKFVSAETIEKGPATQPEAAAPLPSTAPEAVEAIEAGKAAADKWLALVDAGDYARAWDAAPAFAKSGSINKEQWQTLMKTFREPLGKALSRKLISAQFITELPGAPKGEYVVLQYQTDFQNKKEAVETITPAKDADGQWRVSGYFIK